MCMVSRTSSRPIKIRSKKKDDGTENGTDKKDKPKSEEKAQGENIKGPEISMLKHRSVMNYEPLEKEILKMCNISGKRKTVHSGVERQFEVERVLKIKENS